MTKTLIQHGNSLALVIDKPILEMLHISADTPLELTTNGDSLLVSPVRDKARQGSSRVAGQNQPGVRRRSETPGRVGGHGGLPQCGRRADSPRRSGGLVRRRSWGRDMGLLESAVAQPQATFGGEFLHKDLFEMAAAYLFHIVQNHPFLDGNKRTGAVAALVFWTSTASRSTPPRAASTRSPCRWQPARLARRKL